MNLEAKLLKETLVRNRLAHEVIHPAAHVDSVATDNTAAAHLLRYEQSKAQISYLQHIIATQDRLKGRVNPAAGS